MPIFGGGGSNRYARRQIQLEEERRRRIDESLGTINRLFEQNSPQRERLYDRQRDAQFNLDKSSLDRQYGDRTRDSKYNFARRGLLGSSGQTFTTRRLYDDYLEGINRATQRGDEAAARLRQGDEALRTNLTNAALGGLDSANVQAQFAAGQASNLQSNRPLLTNDIFGGLFGIAGPSAVQRAAEQSAARDYRRYQSGLT